MVCSHYYYHHQSQQTTIFPETAQESGVRPQQLLHFYATVIRPVLEYCSPVWHYAITRLQTEHLESIQKRAIHIIYPFTWGMSYLPAALRAAQTFRYLVYAEADFEVFRPARATRCTDGGEIWQGGDRRV